MRNHNRQLFGDKEKRLLATILTASFSLFLCGVLVVSFDGPPIFAAEAVATSNSYKLTNSVHDSGGNSSAESNYKMIFQSFSPSVVGQSSGGDKKVVQGTHFSSEVFKVDGFQQPFERDGVTLNAEARGTITTQVQFKAKLIDNSELDVFPSSVDSTKGNGWGLNWASTGNVPLVQKHVKIMSRAYDGLTWGPWFETDQSFTIDNDPPDILGLSTGLSPFSPHNLTSIGVRDTATLNFNIEEDFLKSWEIKIIKDGVVTRTFSSASTENLTISEVWNGNNIADEFSPDGDYIVEVRVEDMVGHETISTSTVAIDDTSPSVPIVALLSEGQSVNSSKGDVQASWTAEDNADAELEYDVTYAFSGFSPRNYTGLQLWLDAADHKRFKFSGGNTIEEWKDKSGNGFNARQTSQARQPTLIDDGMNGNKAVRFDSQYLDLDATSIDGVNGTSFTIFVVSKVDGGSGSFRSPLTSRESAPDKGFVFYANENDEWDFWVGKGTSSGGGWSQQDVKSPVVPGKASVLTARYNEATIRQELFVDRALINSKRTPMHRNESFVGRIGAGKTEAEADYFFEGDISEVIIYNRALDDDARLAVENYLDLKWNVSQDYAWNNGVKKGKDKSWGKSSLGDNTSFVAKVVAVDDAGNSAFGFSNVVQTPDRTPPLIGEYDFDISGNPFLKAPFNTLNTVEDHDLNYDPSKFKYDEVSSGAGLTWGIDVYTNAENPVKSAEEVLKSATVISENQLISLVVSPDANTDRFVDPTLDGNIYGKSEAWVKVKLYDEEGNFTQQDVQVNIIPVNDAPVLVDIGSQVVRDPASGLIVYNFKFDEDTQNPATNLDAFVIDVDNLKSDLTWTASGNNFSELTDANFSGSSYANDYFGVQIAAANDNHRIFLNPTANWWGDVGVSLNVADFYEVASQNVIVRVWPVNDAPKISAAIPIVTQKDEDNSVVLDFSDYEDDEEYEDRAPTYNEALKWSVESYDTAFIQSISNQNSLDDELTFVPVDNKFGTTNVVLRLTDTDNLPTQYFSGFDSTYIPAPKSVTKSVTLVWYPVNDAPTIAGIQGQVVPDEVKLEDAASWQVNLRDFERDLEDRTGVDRDGDLNWTVSVDKENVLNHSFDGATNTITFTPIANAWGTANVTVTLTDTDSLTDADGNSLFSPYTPNPKSVQQTYKLTMSPVNDAPSLHHLSINGLHPDIVNTVVKAQDIISVKGIGFGDIGWDHAYATTSESYDATKELRNAVAPGDEYPGQNVSDPSFVTNFTNNKKLYRYQWFLDGSAHGALIVTSNPVVTLDTDPTMEGKTITVEVTPDDGELLGNTLTKEVKVNRRPTIVAHTQASPTSNSYDNTGTVPVAWPTATDADGDDIFYRAKVWKVAKWGPQPETIHPDAVTDEAVGVEVFYDTGWTTSVVDGFTNATMGKLYEHGTYHWTVWTGNRFDNNDTNSAGVDYGDPLWMKHFNVDLVNPELQGFETVVHVSQLGQNAVVQDAGNTRLLFGEKPGDPDDAILYRITLEWDNHYINPETEVITTQSGSVIIVDTTDASDWRYLVSYPQGTTTYNILIEDAAGNIGSFDPVNFPDPVSTYTFTITDDTTPPFHFKIFADEGFDTEGEAFTTFEKITSSSYGYFISGKKEEQSAIYYVGYNTVLDAEDESQIVGFSGETFGMTIYPEKPAGYFYGIDRAGNITSTTTSVNIRFILDGNFVAMNTQSRSVINTDANTQELTDIGLTAEEITDLTKSTITWTPSRQLTAYSITNADGAVLASGTGVAKDTAIQSDVLGSSTLLAEGDNVLTLKGIDEAYNDAVVTFNVTAMRVSPNADVVNVGSEITRVDNLDTSTVVWKLKVYGNTVDNVTAFVNGIEVTQRNNNTWDYFNNNFDPINNNVILEVVDSVNNKTVKNLWKKEFYANYASASDISLPITEIGVTRVAQFNGIILNHGPLPGDVSGLFSHQLSPYTYSSHTGLTDDNQSSAFLGIMAADEFEMTEPLKENVYQIFGRQVNTAEPMDVDLSSTIVKIGLPFKDTVLIQKDNLRIVKFNEEMKRWEDPGVDQMVDIENSRVIAEVSQTGIWALAEYKSYAANLGSVNIFPNPWLPVDGDNKTGTLATGITFENLTTNARIRIYTVSGQLVQDAVSNASTWKWYGRNENNNDVFSGVYLYVITDGEMKKAGKLTVIR